MDEIVGLLRILTVLPMPWKITFAVVFLLIPKVIDLLGGTKVVRLWIINIGEWIKTVVGNHQARREMAREDFALTQAYTRTLVVQSLEMFAQRLERMDHKINFIVVFLDAEAKVEEIEDITPERDWSETAKLKLPDDYMERLSAQRKNPRRRKSDRDDTRKSDTTPD